MTLEKIFHKIIHTRGLLTSLGYTNDAAKNLRRQKVSVEKKREVLLKAGYVMVKAEQWEKK